MVSRFKIFSDPVHGFISVPKRLILPLIETPEVQRLRRIRQLGLGHLVFPGAEHTRLQHSLGAMALMQEALATLSEKGTPISEAEHEAALAAALLHDAGHGPFSHTLEHELIRPDAAGRHHHHERMSRRIMQRLNRRFGGALDQALAIFDGTHPRPFFHRLVSSQLDMDRLDYLRRDSFYTGVAEGVVGVDRIIKTLRVHPSDGGPGADVVIEAKGAYAVESFILSRRLMYWQVYLHKTVIAADHLLRSAFARARRRCAAGDAAVRASSPPLLFFLENVVTASDIEDERVVDAFCDLDDIDVLASMKRWMRSNDRVLAELARRFIDRELFRTTYLAAAPDDGARAAWRRRVARWIVERGLDQAAGAADAADLFIHFGTSRVATYTDGEDTILILDRDGRVRALSDTAEMTAVGHLAGAAARPYVCAPKDIDLGVPAAAEAR